jgi:MYXO-CTERM domain-containing protein
MHSSRHQQAPAEWQDSAECQQLLLLLLLLLHALFLRQRRVLLVS